MAKYVTEIPTTMSAQEVFTYMADFSNSQEWDPSIKSSSKTSSGAVGIGTNFSLEYKLLGKTKQLTYVITKFIEPHVVVLECDDKFFHATDEMHVSATDSGSLLTYNAVVKFKGAFRLIDPIFGFLFKSLGNQASARISKVLNDQ